MQNSSESSDKNPDHSATCAICNKLNAKYRCLNCSAPYCSIQCCKKHKLNHTESQYSNDFEKTEDCEDLNEDFEFLTNIGRKLENHCRFRTALEGSLKTSNALPLIKLHGFDIAPKSHRNYAEVVQNANVFLSTSPKFTARARRNSSRIGLRKANEILWHLEISFQNQLFTVKRVSHKQTPSEIFKSSTGSQQITDSDCLIWLLQANLSKKILLQIDPNRTLSESLSGVNILDFVEIIITNRESFDTPGKPINDFISLPIHRTLAKTIGAEIGTFQNIPIYQKLYLSDYNFINESVFQEFKRKSDVVKSDEGQYQLIDNSELTNRQPTMKNGETEPSSISKNCKTPINDISDTEDGQIANTENCEERLLKRPTQPQQPTNNRFQRYLNFMSDLRQSPN